MWIDALAARARVVLVTTPCSCGLTDPRIKVIRAERSSRKALSAAARVMRDNLPRHSLLAAPYRWRKAIAGAFTGEAIDTSIILLSRTDPWVRQHVSSSRSILDAIDSAAEACRERARAEHVSGRFWRSEAQRSTQLEVTAAGHYDDVVVVSPTETSLFQPNATSLGMGVEIGELDTRRERRFDFGFFGQLSFYANRDAVERLILDIWPRIRERRPHATLFLGGAHATTWQRSLDGQAGVHVVSPVYDRSAAMREVRVALLPLAYGSGQSTKTIEAAEAGCAIVGTPSAFRGLPELELLSVVETDSHLLASRAIEALDAGPSPGLRLRDAVRRFHSRNEILERMASFALK